MKYPPAAPAIAVATLSVLLAACGGSTAQPANASPTKPSAVASAPSQAVSQPSAAASVLAAAVASASKPNAAASQSAPPAQQAASFDQMFIDMMVPHHQGAIEMAQIAQQRAEHSEIKKLAGFIITAQNKEIGDMRGWRKDWFGTDQTPSMDQQMTYNMSMPGMSSMMNMASDVRALRTASPFDLAFINAMIPHHQGAIEMAQAAAIQAQHQEIKVLAQSIIKDQQSDIAQMQDWRKAWYPSASPAAAGGMPGMPDMPDMAH